MRVFEGLAMWFVGQHTAKAERRFANRRARARSRRVR
jgi:hypothetical protein